MKVATACAFAALPLSALYAQVPIADYHQHLFSPQVAALINSTTPPRSPASAFKSISATDLIALLDSAAIERALVLSVAYTWGSANRHVTDEYAHVKAENDWTSRQVARYPGRLRGFCSFNPLKSYAMKELERCAKDPQLHRGLKLHFGNSDVDLDNAQDVARVRKVFEAADRYHMPIVVHLHTSFSLHRGYGAKEATVFLNDLLPAAPHVPIQVAHLAGGGGYDATTDSALSVFVEAIARHDARMKNVWFDVATVVRPGIPSNIAQLVATRIRAIGVTRVLYGSDAAEPGNLPPREGWEAFRSLLLLTNAEFRTIASNVPPYMHW